MKKYTEEELDAIYKARRNRLAAYLHDTDIGACIFIDSEEHRDPAVPYYTNHPSDAAPIVKESPRQSTYLTPPNCSSFELKYFVCICPSLNLAITFPAESAISKLTF